MTSMTVAGMVEAADGLGQAVVVGEDDDLAGLPPCRGGRGRGRRRASRVHGLDGIVDDDEAERALGEGGARDEEAEGQGVLLALAHDAEGGAFGAVDRDVELDLALGGGAGEADVLEGDVALQAELVPDLLGLLLDGGEALVADVGGGLLEPGFGGLQGLDGFAPFWAFWAWSSQAARGLAMGLQLVFAALELGGGLVADCLGGRLEAFSRLFDVLGQGVEVGVRR